MDIKYIGMDVHKEAISIAVMNGDGKLVMEFIIETKAITILQFIQGVRGDLHVTFEEGTWAAWRYQKTLNTVSSKMSNSEQPAATVRRIVHIEKAVPQDCSGYGERVRMPEILENTLSRTASNQINRRFPCLESGSSSVCYWQWHFCQER